VLTKDPVLVDLHGFMNWPDDVGFLNESAGQTRGAWRHVTATRYRPGHFCEMHDHSADDGERLIAFVLNMTPRWRLDWGGLFLFVDDRGRVSRGLTLSFNALNLFRTPQPHSVSAVMPFAGANRLTITGWRLPNA
jgi:Rps23 Pro-64 3,4-dihydroxylase Tpa1-like proline 4-hydroxylase